MIGFLFVIALAQDWPPPIAKEAARLPPGLIAEAGTRGTPKKARSLEIRDKGGVYENYLIDAEWADRDAVRILADRVVLRHCEIRNGLRDAIEVYANDVLIENCRIHHFLAGSLKDPKDAHGITGRPTRLTVRNCEIYYCSGDAVQFDPDRGPWTDVIIENCNLWTGPLPEDAAGFKKGEQPGENGLDTKQSASNDRSRIVVRNTLAHGWAKGGQISNLSALNIKNHVDARVENCVFWDNEIDLRLRGGTGKYGGALVAVTGCFFYSSDVAVRSEDAIENLSITNCAYAKDVAKRFVNDAGRGLKVEGDRDAPPRDAVLKRK